MEACQNDAGTIVTSLRFATAPSAPVPSGGGIVGVWERVTASPPAGRYNYATKQWQYDPVAAMNQFRHQWRYRFENNGTFLFELDGEDFNRNERTYSVERGSYSLSGGSLTLTPRECQAGKSPRGQNTPLKPCAVPGARTSRIVIGEHPQYKDSVGLQFLEKDGSWVTYKPAR